MGLRTPGGVISRKKPIVHYFFSLRRARPFCTVLCLQKFLSISIVPLHRTSALETMADREDSVYQAKLAEQAERYDGESKFYLSLIYVCDENLDLAISWFPIVICCQESWVWNAKITMRFLND